MESGNLIFQPENLDDKILEKLKSFESLLQRWNANIKIFSAGNEHLVWNRHIVDSLQMIPKIKGSNKVADMGTGIGFPSIPLAIACPDINFFAIEPNEKKSALITQVIRELTLPNVHVLPYRVEKVVISHVDIVCCRAFGEFLRDAQLAYKMLKPAGLFITFKSEFEDRVPKGFDRVNNYPYRLPNYLKEFNLVVAEKFCDFD